VTTLRRDLKEASLHVVIATLAARESNQASGGEIYARNLSEFLRAKGYSVDFVGDDAALKGAGAREILRHIPALHAILVSLIEAAKLRSENWFRDDTAPSTIVNTQGRGIHLFGFLLKKASRTTVWVATHHNTEEFWIANWTRAFGGKHSLANAVFMLPQTIAMYMIELLSVFRADIVIASSPLLAERYLKLGAESTRVVVIPPGAATIGKATAPTRLSPYLFVGRDSFVKGADVARAAYDIYRQAGGERQLLMAGVNPFSESMTGMEFVGEVDEETKQRLIRTAYAVVIPSRYDTGPIVALEALSAGIPVIISDKCGLSRYVGCGGYGVVTEPRAERIGAAMLELDEKTAEYASCRERILRTFDLFWEKVLGQYETCFESALARSLNPVRRG
jgi:glycosyltransferase involved in cell wall biosynthesis